MEKRTTAEIVAEIVAEIGMETARSAWSKGVKEYAEELAENLEYLEPDDFCAPAMVRKALLNGASDWYEYSMGGCSLIYDSSIAERLANPTELKRTNYGEKDPNPHETWLDCQARALSQAARMVSRIARGVANG